MFWLIVGLGFVLTVIYLFLSNSKRKNKYTILIALLMVASTLLLSLAANRLEKLFTQRDDLANNDNSTSNFETDNTTIHTDGTLDFSEDDISTPNTIEPTNSSVGDTIELFAYEKNGKWGYVDSAGKVVIPFIYDTAYEFQEGLAAVRVDYAWGFIDQNGKTIIPFEYDGAWNFLDGLAPVYKDGLWGFINHNNEISIDFKYSNITQQNGAYFDENDKKIIY